MSDPLVRGEELLGIRRLLVVAPHPDDEVLGCGGLLARLARAGAEVDVLVLTDGAAVEPEPAPALDVVAARAAECRAAAARLGVAHVRFLGLPDGHLSERRADLQVALTAVLAEARPQWLLAPSPLDHHADHRAAGHAARTAAEASPEVGLGFYAVYGALRFHALVEIGAAIEDKIAALRLHRHGCSGDPEPFVEAARGLARFYSLYVRRTGDYEAVALFPPGTPRDAATVDRWFRYET